MIELAVALDLAEHGFGTYGETIFVNESPILDTGAVSSKDGIWITSTTMSNGNGHYTDQLTISPASSIDLDAVDSEGHYVKSIHFAITYPLPDLNGVKVIN